MRKTLPTIGAFGYLVLFTDETLRGATPSPTWESEGLLSGDFALMPEGDADWIDRVEFELHFVDFIVFDWLTTPTESMHKEFEIAEKLLPPDRLIWITLEREATNVRQLVEKQLGTTPQILIFDGSRFKLGWGLMRVIAASKSRIRWRR